MKNRLHWWWYYQVTRRKQRFLPWLAHRLPKRLKYWVIIDVMAHYTVVINPHAHPDEVKGWDLLRTCDDQALDYDRNR